MNWRLVIGTLEEKISSPARLSAIAMFLAFPVIQAYVGRADPTAWHLIMYYVFSLGTGIIGADVSSGVLQLIFTRPISRSAYVLSRWLGLVAAVLAVYAFQIIVTSGIMLSRGHSFSDINYGEHLMEAVLLTMALSAVIICLSSILTGYGDLRAILLLWLLQIVCEMFRNSEQHAELFSVLGSQISGVLIPSLDINLVLHGEPYGWLLIVPYVAVLVASLVIAIFVMNRKELSYAAS